MRNDARFMFHSYESDKKGATLVFRYELMKNGNTHQFKETIRLPHGTTVFSIPEPMRTKILENLLLILGISYWKAFCPKKMIIPPLSLTQKQAIFWNTVYKKGLGEFFYRNKIDFCNLIRFPYKKGAEIKATSHIKTSNSSLLLWGGGKDSIVAGELLKKQKKQFSLLAINPVTIQKDTARIMQKPMLAIRRTIDSQLFSLNKKGVHNGHIPMSAVYAFLGILAGLLEKKRFIIAANEASANYGNVRFLGKEVNHQWSKSYEFEKMFREYVSEYITHDVEYFSLLRPLSELDITERFSKRHKYFGSFSSCNRNFSILKPRKITHWCGVCPKCAFIFAALAAYISEKQLIKIFKKNLFADDSLLPLYKELFGLTPLKPFECVGTPEEVKMAFFITYKKNKFIDTSTMRFFINSVLPNIRKFKKPKTTHLIPNEFSFMYKTP